LLLLQLIGKKIDEKGPQVYGSSSSPFHS